MIPIIAALMKRRDERTEDERGRAGERAPAPAPDSGQGPEQELEQEQEQEQERGERSGSSANRPQGSVFLYVAFAIALFITLWILFSLVLFGTPQGPR